MDVMNGRIHGKHTVLIHLGIINIYISVYGLHLLQQILFLYYTILLSNSIYLCVGYGRLLGR